MVLVNMINKKLFSILFICSIAVVQNAYSYHYDEYKGRVKYGTYHCVKDGKTCDFERIEGSASYGGDACPHFEVKENISKDKFIEERDKFNEQMADFLNSEYCTFTPSNVKKYVCNYDIGYATIYLKNGKVVSASYPNNMPERNLQDLYEPDKCKETEMEGDSGEPPLKQNDNLNQDTDNNVNIYKNYENNSYQGKENNDTQFEKDFSKFQERRKSHKAFMKKMKRYEFYLSILVLLVVFLLSLCRKDDNPYHKL